MQMLGVSVYGLAILLTRKICVMFALQFVFTVTASTCPVRVNDSGSDVFFAIVIL